MAKKYVTIVGHGDMVDTMVEFDPKTHSATAIVEKVQKNSIHYQAHGRLPGCTWKVVDTALEALVYKG